MTRERLVSDYCHGGIVIGDRLYHANARDGLHSTINQLGVLRMMKVTLENPNVNIAVARQVTAEALAGIRVLGAHL